MSMEMLGPSATPAGAISGLFLCVHLPAPPGNPLLTGILSLPEGRGHKASPTGYGGRSAGCHNTTYSCCWAPTWAGVE